MRFFFITLILSLTWTNNAEAFEIMVLSSGNELQYTLAGKAFENYMTDYLPIRGVKSIQSVDIKFHIIEKGCERDSVAEIERINPDLLVTIGLKALRTAVETGKPLIFLLVSSDKINLPEKYNGTGVYLDQGSGQEFGDVIRLLPLIKRVGVVYDPDKTGGLVAGAEKAWPRLTFIRAPVTSSKEVVTRLKDLRGNIDLLWMVPDLTAVTPQTEQSYYRFSLEQNVPVLTFSERYLERGATIAGVFDIPAMGEKAGELAIQVVGGLAPGSIVPVPADKRIIKVNKKTADKLKIQFAEPVQ
ncbi:MAG: hypothetical protein OEV64_07400 [Desulfobulbaceae bacterium]|nr:hypothetical protein [Desulfobulbaceae bacterium]